jgi:hypothetical protein
MHLIKAFANVVNLMVIKDLVTDYVDLRLKAMEMMEQVESVPPREPRPLYPPVQHFRTIPVLLPKSQGTKLALVDDDMYDDVSDTVKYCWRLTHSGYIVSNKNKECFYLHKLVYGGPAKHVNGDRFDNRRSNLASAPRKSPDSDFKIKTIRQIDDNTTTFNKDDPELGEFSGFGTVLYEGRSYQGELVKGLPHGYGILRRDSRERSYDMMGIWRAGKMENGMVTYFKPAPSCMCHHHEQCPLREITGLEIIDGGIKIRTVSNSKPSL